MIDTVIFDLDGTLTDHEQTEQEALTAFFDQIVPATKEFSNEELMNLWEQESDRLLQDYFKGRITLERRRILRMQAIFREMGKTLSEQEAYHNHQQYVDTYLGNVAVFPDVSDVLSSLKKYKLGIVSNGESDVQRSKLKGAKIDHFFSAVVISGDLNISKPDPAIFQECLGQLRTRPERAIYVGDHPQKDVGGAVKSGMYGVFIDRHQKQRKNPIPIWRLFGPFKNCLN
ncbi:putative hydrolase of the HAD superfamily [Melghiribacillus thermohalophilus]|uniref:Putative hydrolase of the HAD superfamily n=1 Tax=Melghiribacillus thermohalophilus TaxID=1324956 RepID=A0A4R3MTB7_9BACI|nr:HAD family hydrolase [Melghiribacillus thermohalophilus]TCT19668.1 putative hydrolase of the HAD superfamily [Melghiribacillus thermohalophilus]